MSFFRSFSKALQSKKVVGEPAKPGQKPAKPAISRPQIVRGGKAGKAASYLPQPKKQVAAPGQAPQPNAPAINKTLEQAEQALQQAQNKSREILIEAKSEALKIREVAEQEQRELQNKLVEQQRNLDRQLSTISQRLEQVDRREEQIDKKLMDLETKTNDLEAKREEMVADLEKVSGLTRDQAKQELLDRIANTVDRQAAQMVQQKLEVARQEADDQAKEILIDAMKHGATDYVAEYTISVVKLPDADMKGRIIGKDGRNIRAFERSTGVDVELDGETPDEVRLSSFDPVRREIARISLERLLKDGRIQPSRIDEVVQKVNKELEKIMFEEGKRLSHKVGIFNLPNDLMALLGRFKYRFSYGQNLIQHTLEETQIGIKLANELGLNTRTVTLGCLLHDIGKIVEGDGNHIELGVRLLKKYALPQEVIDCVAQHHEDEPFTSMESMVVYISDAISGSRPGARNENHEDYIQRLGKLEEIALSYPAVEKAFAIQAGREVRVILKPDKSSDRDVNVIATEIAERYENEMTYPGTVTVNVIREIRGNSVAK
jgi:ribonuclease Y